MTPLVCSFDVFDTCLVRSVANGHHVLMEAARRSGTTGPLDDEVVAEAVRLRMLGESRAAAGVRDAVLLDEAYAAAPELAALGIDPERMQLEELGLEREGLRPVAAAVQRIEQVRAQGRRVVFVSDMHLPAALLREVLEEHGMAQPGDAVYVSGELGRSKLTGRLYDHVLREEGLRPEELLHRGDDLWTDLHMALDRGVSVDPFPDGRLSRYERAVQHAPALSAAAGSRLAALSRAVRLGEDSDNQALRLAAMLGGDVVGPLLTGYVRWALDDARDRGVQTLCFVSRDGQVLHEIAQRVRRATDPECRYMYGSRQAWFVAGVAADERSDLSWAFEPRHERATVASVLAKVGLVPDDAREEMQALDLGPDDVVDPSAPGSCGALVEALHPKVMASAREARDLLRDYLGQEGLLDGRSWAVVDVGWYLNAQASLRQAVGPEVPLSGYYLGVRVGRRPLQESGSFRAMVREDVVDQRDVLPGGWVLVVPNLVEHVFVRADHGQCTGYERRAGAVVPVLRAARPQPVWQAALRAAVLRYATAASEAGLLEDGGAGAFAAGDVAGRLFALQPTREEAVLFGSTLVSDDQNETVLRPLAPPLSLDDLGRRLRDRLRGVEAGPESWQHWPAATRAATNPAATRALGTARSALRTGRRGASWARMLRAASRTGGGA